MHRGPLSCVATFEFSSCTTASTTSYQRAHSHPAPLHLRDQPIPPRAQASSPIAALSHPIPEDFQFKCHRAKPAATSPNPLLERVYAISSLCFLPSAMPLLATAGSDGEVLLQPCRAVEPSADICCALRPEQLPPCIPCHTLPCLPPTSTLSQPVLLCPTPPTITPSLPCHRTNQPR